MITIRSWKFKKSGKEIKEIDQEGLIVCGVKEGEAGTDFSEVILGFIYRYCGTKNKKLIGHSIQFLIFNFKFLIKFKFLIFRLSPICYRQIFFGPRSFELKIDYEYRSDPIRLWLEEFS